jgi:hypothetical protein
MYPVIPGGPDYSSTGVNGFIPAIWSSRLQPKYYEETFLTEITNNDWEGEIKNQGDTVEIRGIPDVTVNNYQKGQDLDYENLEKAKIRLLINKGKSWSAACDDIDKYQSDLGLLDMWSSDAVQQTKIKIYRDVLNNIYADADSTNIGTAAGKKAGDYNMGTTTTPVEVNRVSILDVVADMESCLDENDIPIEGRWLVIPSRMKNLFNKSDLQDSSMTGDNQSIIRKGYIGGINNFKIFTCNGYETVSDSGYTAYRVLFGHSSATTFAQQFVDTDALKNPRSFGQLIRGLSVYGYKVVLGTGLGVCYCYFS